MSERKDALRLCDELEVLQKAVLASTKQARFQMKIAGFAVADHHTPLDMVTKLLARNRDQRKIEDGLRERLKAAAEVCATWKQRAEAAEGWIIRKGWITGDTYEVNTEGGTDCPFHIAVGGCNAWRSKENGDWCRCANDGSMAGCPPGLRTPCRLDEGPILVEKAEDDTPSKSAHTLAVEEVDNASRAYMRRILRETQAEDRRDDPDAFVKCSQVLLEFAKGGKSGATEDSGSAADGAGRPPPQQPVAGGDRLNDPGRPR